MIAGAGISSRYEVATSVVAVHRVRGASLMVIGAVGRPTAMILSANGSVASEGQFALAV